MDDAPILKFAKNEAGDIPVEFKIVPQSGDGYEIKQAESGHLITGTNARSCLHGVYHLKQSRPTGSFKAAFRVRGVNPCESLPCHTPDELRRLIDRMGKWRMNTLIIHTVYGWRKHRDLIVAECAKRGIEIVFYVYTFMEFLPPDAPVKWLAKDETGKPITDKLECETRLCMAEPDGIEAFARGAENFFRNNVADANSVLAATGDGFGHCRCPKCKDLSPVEQWQPLLEAFAKAGRAEAPDKLLEAIIYVQRYKLPADMSCHRGLDRLFFDLHQRNKWRPLGATHPIYAFHRETEVDPRAEGVPINVYLLDRFKEWREKFPGALYGFENLQSHGTFSCPQPNTGVLLENLKQLRSLGGDGMVYEILNGMDYFIDQMDVLADGLWDPETAYTPTRLEQWCTEHCPPAPLFFLKQYNFPWDEFKDEWDDALQQHMFNVREFSADLSAPNLKRLIKHVYTHGERFDRQTIAFGFLKRFHEKTPFSGLNEKEQLFLTTTKLWDFMEPLRDPIGEVDDVAQSLLRKC